MTVYEASFIDTAASSTSALRVKIPALDNGEYAHPVTWAPRVNNAGSAIFPTAGGWCAVTETADGTWLCVLWTP